MRRRTKLKSIQEEALDCRAAWVGHGVGTAAWLCHHEILCELLTEPAENRITYILSSKLIAEQATRLRYFRPAPSEALALYEQTTAPAWVLYQHTRAPALALYEQTRAPALAIYEQTRAPALALYEQTTAQALAALTATHRELFPDCPWDGETLFPEGRASQWVKPQ